MLYKNITISKISDHGGTEKTPTHAIVVTDDNYQNKKTVGKLWTKKGDYGAYLTGGMSDDYTKPDGTFFTGYRIISLEEYNKLTGGVRTDTLQGQEAEDNKAFIEEQKKREAQMQAEGQKLVDELKF